MYKKIFLCPRISDGDPMNTQQTVKQKEVNAKMPFPVERKNNKIPVITKRKLEDLSQAER